MVFDSTNGDEEITIHKGLHPSTDNSIALGMDDARYSEIYAVNVYTGDLHLKNERGDWSVIEESDYLTLRHNGSGKRFKILMEELNENDYGPGDNGL